jgi:hypothetical protein
MGNVDGTNWTLDVPCESTGCQIGYSHYVSQHAAPPRPDAPGEVASLDSSMVELARQSGVGCSRPSCDTVAPVMIPCKNHERVARAILRYTSALESAEARLAAAERRAEWKERAANDLGIENVALKTRLAAIEKAARAVLKMTEDVDHIEIITVGAMEKIDALRDALQKP